MSIVCMIYLLDYYRVIKKLEKNKLNGIIVSMYKHLKYAVVFFALSLSSTFATSSTSTVLPQDEKAPFSNTLWNTNEIEIGISESAKSALEAGMPSLAKAIIEDNLKKHNFLQNSKIVNAIYIDALISLGEYKKAENVVKILTDLSPANTLRRTLIFCGLGKNDLAKSGLETLNENALPKALVSWFYLVKGFVLFEEGKIKESINEFTRAKNLSTSSLAKANAEVSIYKAKLSSYIPNEDMLKLEQELKEKTITFLGTIEGFQYAKQYASILFRRGKEKEAIDVINQQLDISLAPEIDKEELNLISASMTKDPEKQIALLKDILVKTTSNEITELAIELMSANPKISSEQFTQSLKKILENSTASRKDRIIIELAKHSIKSNNRQQATIYANQIEKDFPNSKYKSDALRILAWVAWESSPPQYRQAAETLSKLARLQQSDADKNEIKYLEATCYFLDKDYDLSAKIFEEIADKIPSKQNAILNKVVEAYIAKNQAIKALEFIDRAYKSKIIQEEEIWNAEWKLILYYTKNLDYKSALNRINKAIEESSNFSAMLKMRMMWARATITENLENYQSTIDYCDEIVNFTINNKLSNSTVSEIIANTLLLKASSLEKLGGKNNQKSSVEVYEKLRKDYPNTEAASLSYLYQARLSAQQGHYDQAYKLCISLAEHTNNDNLRYDAFVDAAEYSKKIATKNSYQIALSILDKICNDFPDTPRNFYARLWQADILRLSNSFSDAEKLYIDIINNYKNHPEIYLAYMGQGDSIIASKNIPTDAIPIFERLYSLPNVPISAKAEAAFKWVFALRKVEDRDIEADRVAWLTSTALLKNKDLDQIAMYWIGRSLYNMAQSLEEKNYTRDAQAAYELLIKYKLPSYKIAEQKLNKTNKK
ncbi:MAG: tetratricopeptide repeat protein [Opitutales bacterium]|nr:tetratricopeptide repeat protein [Opitutales bacterium]